ncbi:hypothetical protein [Paracoccus fontiphilus]|uniref:Transposase n=1 Tax=Paracoccus fontiphilus TaxID=1815556 RepID=A0ABV7IIK2_9RHOB|nr:hypothetical protein [Paracoccus fontiphilus]
MVFSGKRKPVLTGRGAQAKADMRRLHVDSAMCHAQLQVMQTERTFHADAF